MSWPLAAFAIVFAVLIAGWLAYERSRPSARMAAVVGTLAAVAALGRDAFVALPDVKPITAMTLVVGYALGPLPGFTVGAVGMLASNIVLGQGPYTPWQMAAWGLVGLAGAALGRLSGRRVGRLGLALACALVALAAKEIMNVYTWTLGASHTPAALLAYAGGALPFDLTDAVASFLFGLAFAPELARLLGRMRARMTVTWEAAATPLALLAVCLIAASPAHAGGSPELRYLERAQNRDGGFGAAPGRRSGELYSAWAAMGLAAAGRDPLSLERAGHSVFNSIRAEASSLEGTGDVERTILALRACGVAPQSFPGDLLGRLRAARASDGSFGGLVNITTFAIFALRASGRPAGDPLVRAAGRWLERQQGPDGGFGFAAQGAREDVDDTAAALQGIVDATGAHGAAVTRAVAFLRRAQNVDGGFPQQPGDASNAQSTAWALQALIAAGRDVSSFTNRGSRSPRAYLESLVAPGGAVRYSRTSAQTPVWVTAQALVALSGKQFPIAPPARSPVARHASPSAAPPPTGVPSGAGVAAGAGRGAGASAPGASPAQVRSAPAPRRAKGISARGSQSAARALTSVRLRLQALARGAGMLIGVVLAPMLR
jgi:energy-coupling factor transport system substrate-specific component